MSSRLEVNFKRLLHRCEIMAAEKRLSEWRMEKFVEALQDKLSELKKSPSMPCEDILKDYSRKVEFLKGLVEAEKMEDASEKVLATQLLSTGPALSAVSTAHNTKQLHQQAITRYETDMREELLGLKNKQENTQNGIRQRNIGSGGSGAGGESDTSDLSAVLQHHHQMQEKIAEEMVSLAKNLKENANMANRIIKKDNQVLGESHQHADQNYGKLKTESERLEVHAQKSVNWWIWIMVIVVCFTFIWMVLFMRMFPKR